jgi:hypothetical protein
MVIFRMEVWEERESKEGKEKGKNKQTSKQISKTKPNKQEQKKNNVEEINRERCVLINS